MYLCRWILASSRKIQYVDLELNEVSQSLLINFVVHNICYMWISWISVRRILIVVMAFSFWFGNVFDLGKLPLCNFIWRGKNYDSETGKSFSAVVIDCYSLHASGAWLHCYSSVPCATELFELKNLTQLVRVRIIMIMVKQSACYKIILCTY